MNCSIDLEANELERKSVFGSAEKNKEGFVHCTMLGTVNQALIKIRNIKIQNGV